MNRLDPPNFNDSASLDALAQNKRLNSYPALQPYVALITAGYQHYVAERGNAITVTNVLLPPNVSKHLKSHYDSPPAAIAYIKEMRENSAVDCCPMCGSFHSGTLDHLLPQTDYPTFSIFGPNLVPACGCNSKRGARLVGLAPGERILHPYFDDILGDRLLAARFENVGVVPRILLRLLLSNQNANFPAVRFHMTNIVERTSILRHVKNSWNRMLRRPSLAAAEFRNNPASRQELRDVLAEELDRQDDTHGSKNNWNSIFIVGLLDDHVLDWLFDAFHRPGRQADGPLADVVV